MVYNYMNNHDSKINYSPNVSTFNVWFTITVTVNTGWHRLLTLDITILYLFIECPVDVTSSKLEM